MGTSGHKQSTNPPKLVAGWLALMAQARQHEGHRPALDGGVLQQE